MGYEKTSLYKRSDYDGRQQLEGVEADGREVPAELWDILKRARYDKSVCELHGCVNVVDEDSLNVNERLVLREYDYEHIELARSGKYYFVGGSGGKVIPFDDVRERLRRSEEVYEAMEFPVEHEAKIEEQRGAKRSAQVRRVKRMEKRRYRERIKSASGNAFLK